MSKTTARPSAVIFPVTLTAEEKKHKELQDKYKEMKKKLAEKKAAADKGDKKQGKRTLEEAEEATHELIKKVQEGKITVKKSDDRHTFKRSRLVSATEGSKPTKGIGEDGEITDPYDDDLESSATILWQERRQENNQKTIFVKGMDMNRDDLRETFERYGNIRRININERQKHAFIEFNHPAEAETAIRGMNGHFVDGTAVHVSFAKRREGGGGGGGQRDDRGGAFDDMCSNNIA